MSLELYNGVCALPRVCKQVSFFFLSRTFASGIVLSNFLNRVLLATVYNGSQFEEA
jgi:hypothetical protein